MSVRYPQIEFLPSGRLSRLGWPLQPAPRPPFQGEAIPLSQALRVDALSLPRFGATKVSESSAKEAKPLSQRAWNKFKRVGWVIRRAAEHVLDVVKWVLLVMVGVFAFLPVPERMRAYIERLFLKGPMKSDKLSSQKDEVLKSKIRVIDDLNMGQFQNELKRTKLGFDAAQDKIKLHAWYIPGDKDKPCIVYSHGRGSNVSHHEGLLKSWMDRGYGVFIYDYPNFGRSEGKATEKAFYKSGLVASLYVKKNLHFPVENQVLMGNSLGSAVVANTLEHLRELNEKPKAAALISTFPSIREAFVFNRKKFGVLGKLLNEERIKVKLDVAEALKKNTQTPVLLLQGQGDKRTPVAMITGMLEKMGNSASRKQIDTAWMPGLQHCLRDKDFAPLVAETARYLQKLDEPSAKLKTTA